MNEICHLCAITLEHSLWGRVISDDWYFAGLFVYNLLSKHVLLQGPRSGIQNLWTVLHICYTNIIIFFYQQCQISPLVAGCYVLLHVFWYSQMYTVDTIINNFLSFYVRYTSCWVISGVIHRGSFQKKIF